MQKSILTSRFLMFCALVLVSVPRFACATDGEKPVVHHYLYLRTSSLVIRVEAATNLSDEDFDHVLPAMRGMCVENGSTKCPAGKNALQVPDSFAEALQKYQESFDLKTYELRMLPTDKETPSRMVFKMTTDNGEGQLVGGAMTFQKIHRAESAREPAAQAGITIEKVYLTREQ